MSRASGGAPNSSASPSVGANRPVSIFIVVVLPQPLEPTKPKISPRSMVKLTRSTAVKSPKRQVRSRAVMTGLVGRRYAAGFAAAGGPARRSSGSSAMKASSTVFGVRLRLELGRRTGREDLSIVHGHEVIETLGLFHVGGGDHHAHAGASRADAIDQLPELSPRQRIDAGRGLVEDQKVRIVNERAAEAELLPHAARQFLRRPVGEGREPGAVQKLGNPPIALGARLPEHAAEEFDVFADAEVGIEVFAQPLRHIGDARADRGAVRGVARCRRPSTKTRPDWICRAPAMMLSSVDLPTPSAPIRPTMQPLGRSIETASSAATRP